jgi:hypothetical protein
MIDELVGREQDAVRHYLAVNGVIDLSGFNRRRDAFLIKYKGEVAGFPKFTKNDLHATAARQPHTICMQ